MGLWFKSRGRLIGERTGAAAATKRSVTFSQVEKWVQVSETLYR